MHDLQPSNQFHTHLVINQSHDMSNVNLFNSDIPLQEAVQREGAGWASDELSALGSALGSDEYKWHGEQANKNPPILKQFNRYGQRIDFVEYHPSYHAMMFLGKIHCVHSTAWLDDVRSKGGGHVLHSAKEFMLGQVESGVCCPITMTYAVVPALKHIRSDRWEELHPKLLSNTYDSRFVPISEKHGITMGMAMTEKQGGSDVRANSTLATHIVGDEYELTGHKWFCSAPMSDAFLTLAQTSKGLTCFFVPRFRFDGTKNRFFIQRLKDKLGNKSNASSEIEYDKTYAIRVGEEGRGVATIIEMVHHTRLDCALAAVGLMRQSLREAIHHARHRSVFGKLLIEQPLMRNVLVDLAVEMEASLMMGFRVARAYDEGEHSEEAKTFARLAVAVSKYWTNKRCSTFVNEAMECLGGGGYVEESILPRLYREAPLNGIWEGSGNVICLDVLRTFAKDKDAIHFFLQEVQKAKGSDTRFDRYLIQTIDGIQNGSLTTPATARILTERLAILLQSSLMLQFGHQQVANVYMNKMFSNNRYLAHGTLDCAFAETETILNRFPS